MVLIWWYLESNGGELEGLGAQDSVDMIYIELMGICRPPKVPARRVMGYCSYPASFRASWVYWDAPSTK